MTERKRENVFLSLDSAPGEQNMLKDVKNYSVFVPNSNGMTLVTP